MRQTARRWWRLKGWLAALCLLASLAYLEREPGLPMPVPMSGMQMPASHEPASQPPAGHDHQAHCPFCFTAAFALEAAGVVLPAPHLERAAAAPASSPGLLHRASVHADARAPPRSA